MIHLTPVIALQNAQTANVLLIRAIAWLIQHTNETYRTVKKNHASESSCPHCGSASKFHPVNRRYCAAYQNNELEILKNELIAVKAAIIATVGGIDYEGIPTNELNYLQRLRILVDIEKANSLITQ